MLIALTGNCPQLETIVVGQSWVIKSPERLATPVNYGLDQSVVDALTNFF